MNSTPEATSRLLLHRLMRDCKELLKKAPFSSVHPCPSTNSFMEEIQAHDDELLKLLTAPVDRFEIASEALALTVQAGVCLSSQRSSSTSRSGWISSPSSGR